MIQKKTVFVILKETIKLIAGGLFIGFFHEKDVLVAIVLAIYPIYSFTRKIIKKDDDLRIVLIGMVLTGVLGILAENWGIYNQYWEYHGLEAGRVFPLWLPFAWMSAFTVLYKLEKGIIIHQNIKNLQSKITLFLIISLVFPTVGEMITIYLGVWTYAWPLQLFGVPILAIFLLIVFHLGVSFLLFLFCKKFSIYNVVYFPFEKKVFTA